MRGPDALKKAEDNWHTDMGAWFSDGRTVLRGKDLFNELDDLSWFKYHMFGITGKMFSDSQINLIEKIWTLTVSYPDPRLWNNRVAALSATAGSTGILGSSAAIGVSEAKTYGNQVSKSAIHFIKNAIEVDSEDKNLSNFLKSELRENRVIPGYGRPIIATDERIQPLLNEAKKYALDKGPHVKLAFKIEKLLITLGYRLRMNAAGLIVALMADLGFSENEFYYYSILAFSSGIIPCHIDAANQKEGTFFPLNCGRLNYTGVEKRHW
ncbi:MAG: hypothetical protein V7682_09405 [Cycloclasticus sp.]